LDQGTEIAVGRLGTHFFPAGYYVYLGSALGGLVSRVGRHVRGGSRVHWHVDYLRRHAAVAEVWYVISDQRWECSWYRAASAMPQAVVPVAGFGSSGCGCPSHLVYFASVPSFERFRRKVEGSCLGLRRLTPGTEDWKRLLTGN
jgi:Uri superfamily endonuclease